MPVLHSVTPLVRPAPAAMDLGEGGAREGEGEAEALEIELLDDEDEGGDAEGVPLQGLSAVPLIVSVAVVGQRCVLDPSLLEERAASSTLHVAVSGTAWVHSAFVPRTERSARCERGDD